MKARMVGFRYIEMLARPDRFAEPPEAGQAYDPSFGPKQRDPTDSLRLTDSGGEPFFEPLHQSIHFFTRPRKNGTNPLAQAG